MFSALELNCKEAAIMDRAQRDVLFLLSAHNGSAAISIDAKADQNGF